MKSRGRTCMSEDPSDRGGIGSVSHLRWSSLVAQTVKHLPARSIRGSGRSGEGNGNPLQYSCLENPMDGGAW